MTGPITAPAETRPERPSLVSLVLAPIPGIGHWAIRRGGRGLLAFMLFAAGMNLLLMSTVMEPVSRLSPAWGWAFASAAMLYSIVDVTRIVLERRRVVAKRPSHAPGPGLTDL